MDFSKSVYEIIKDNLDELREEAKEKTIKELASDYGVSYGKMSMILRFKEIQAKRPEVHRKVKCKAGDEETKPKKDHVIANWAQTYNHGRIRYVYYDMIRRCYKLSDNHYKDYGGRGIKVCDEWKEDCCNFYKWARDNGYKEGLQLDRKNNNKGYYPDNCHWVSPSDNAYNKRNTRMITYKGKTQNLRDWAKETGISKYILADRIYKYGWNIDRALTEQPK